MSAKLSFEALPPVIQELIFQHLQAPDLLQITSLSQSLYWAAAGQLYKSITVTDELSYELAQKHVSGWRVNGGTLLPYKSFKKLVDTVSQKPELGELVHKFTFHNRVKINENALLSFFAHTPHLSELHNFSRFAIPPATAEKLQRVTCALGQSLKHAKNLCELRIRDFNDNISVAPEQDESEDELSADSPSPANDTPRPSDASSYKQLAQDLVESGAHASLKKLHFSSGQNIGGQDCGGQYLAATYSGNWQGFFAQLNSRKVRLDLDALAIHGVPSGSAAGVAKSIAGSVDLGELKQLVLVNDDCPSHQPDETFLELLTKKTPQLESLAVFFTPEYSTFELQSLDKVLAHHIPHQLKDLSVVMTHDDCMPARYDLQQNIGETQKNLVRVRIEDTLPLTAGPNPYQAPFDPYGIEAEMDDLFDSNDSNWSDELDRQHFFPDVIADMHTRPTLSASYAAALRNGMKTLRKCMNLDIVYKDAQRKLPHLQQYYIGGAYFDMKNRGIFVNEGTVALKTKTPKRPAFVDLGISEQDMVDAAKDIASHLDGFGPEAWKQVYELLVRESELPPGQHELLAGLSLD